MKRRTFLRLTAGAAAVPVASRLARAQAYPNRFVRLIVPFPPGGAGDALGRPVAQRLSEVWGQQVVVENRGGAAGNLGAQAVVNAPPDGYTLLLGSAFLSINPYLYQNSGYDPVTSLVPVTLLCVIPISWSCPIPRRQRLCRNLSPLRNRLRARPHSARPASGRRRI